MRYIAPKEAVMHMLRTGDRDVLSKVDPSRKQELVLWLKHAQTELQKKKKAQDQYAALYKRVAAKEAKQESEIHPWRRGVEEWPSGQRYSDLRKTKPRVVRFDPANAMAADVDALLSGLDKD